MTRHGARASKMKLLFENVTRLDSAIAVGTAQNGSPLSRLQPKLCCLEADRPPLHSPLRPPSTSAMVNEKQVHALRLCIKTDKRRGFDQ